eukprot:jgi/Mesen1/10218/ME000770S09641
MWAIWPLITAAVNKWAADHFENAFSEGLVLVDMSEKGQAHRFVYEGWEKITGYALKDVVGLQAIAGLWQMHHRLPASRVVNAAQELLMSIVQLVIMVSGLPCMSVMVLLINGGQIVETWRHVRMHRTH